MARPTPLTDAERSEVVEMALADDVPFATIEMLYGMREKEVVALMRATLKAGSYRAWRRRVRVFGDRRAWYK